MKRVHAQEAETDLNHLPVAESMVDESPKGTGVGTNRKVRTSAAMIGLALSMGASGVLVPHENDGAAASEPNSPDLSVSSSSEDAWSASSLLPSEDLEIDADKASTGLLASAAATRYTVRAGQSLWQIAQSHGVDAQEIATFNNLRVNEVLHVGQVLRIPLQAGQAADAVQADIARQVFPSPTTEASLPASSELAELLTESTPSSTADEDRQARVEQAESRVNLQQKRVALQESLTSLKQGDRTAPSLDQTIALEIDGSSEAESSEVSWGSSLPITPLSEPNVSGESRTAQSALLSAAEVNSDAFLRYQVQSGDTLDKLAQLYGTSREDIISANRLANPDTLQVNQALLIPQDKVGADADLADESRLHSVDLSSERPEVFLPNLDAKAPVADSQVADTSSSEAFDGLGGQMSPGVPGLGETVSQADDLSLLVPDEALSSSSQSSIASKPASPQIDTSAKGINEEVELASGSLAQDNVNPYVLGLRAEIDAIRQARNPGSESQHRFGETVTSSEAEPSPTAATLSLSSLEATPSSSSTSRTQTSPNPYVEGLWTEIQRMREKQEDSSSQTAPVVEEPRVGELQAAAPSQAESILPEQETAAVPRVNPAFESREERLETEGTTNFFNQEELSDGPVAAPAADVPEHLLAVAPLGSETYEPVVKPLVGRVVSPNLPSMPGVDELLPESPSSPTIFNGYIWPAQGVFTSGYGWRWGRMHHGIDVAAPVGTPIYAAASGVVETSGWNSGGYGNLVEIRHADGSLTLYAHNSRLLVQKGQTVSQGQQIAEMGSTGYSTGPHLHFEIHMPGQGSVNPVAHLPSSRG